MTGHTEEIQMGGERRVRLPPLALGRVTRRFVRIAPRQTRRVGRPKIGRPGTHQRFSPPRPAPDPAARDGESEGGCV